MIVSTLNKLMHTFHSEFPSDQSKGGNRASFQLEGNLVYRKRN